MHSEQPSSHAPSDLVAVIFHSESGSAKAFSLQESHTVHCAQASGKTEEAH